MEDSFKLIRYGLRLMGHSLDFNAPQHLRKWRIVKHIVALALVLLAQYPLINYTIYHIDDLTLATASLSIAFTNLLTVVKTATFLCNKLKFMELMRKFEVMFRRQNKPEAKAYLIDGNKNAKVLVSAYFFATASTGVYFIVGPLIKMAWANLMGSIIVRELPMPMRFPFSAETTPGYELAFIYTIFVTFCVIMHAIIIDGLFLTFTLNLRAHFQVLQYYIRTNSFSKSDAILLNELSTYVQYHDLLLDLAKIVRLIYLPIVFCQFLVTSLQVCVIVYQLVTHMDAIMILMVYCAFFISIMLQLFIYCYGGEVLRSESLMVGTAVQLSDWYKLKPKYRRMLCMMLMRSQREVIIKAGFYEASLANFMTILKAALSYITLIQSIEKKDVNIL